MHVHVADVLQLGDLAEVVIVGEQLRAEVAGQPDELGVHFRFLREIAVVDFDLVARVALDAVEHFEAAPAPRALDGVVGIGDLLEFLEHKARHDDDAFEEIGLDQIGDAAVNDRRWCRAAAGCPACCAARSGRRE